eukprot:1572399-Ditylum_brightwellii.AAC.1
MACHSLNVAIAVVIAKQTGGRAVVIIHINGSTHALLVFVVTTFDIECAEFIFLCLFEGGSYFGINKRIK